MLDLWLSDRANLLLQLDNQPAIYCSSCYCDIDSELECTMFETVMMKSEWDKSVTHPKEREVVLTGL